MTRIDDLGNPELHEAYQRVVNLFLDAWQDDRPGNKNYQNESMRLWREFNGLLHTFPSFTAELADAFAFDIRQELRRVEEKAINWQPYVHADEDGNLKDAFSPAELAAWLTEQQDQHEEAVTELLHGPLPEVPTQDGVFNSARYRTLYYRHKIAATIDLYKGIVEVFKKNTPASFPQHRALPSYYFSSSKPAPPLSPWEPLLIGEMKLTDFFGFLADCGLRATNGELTALGRGKDGIKARKAPWIGTLRALIDADLLDGNAAAICRAMKDPNGKIEVSVSENAVRDQSAKADTYFKTANARLKELGLLRK